MGNNEDYLDSLLNNVTKKLSEFDEDFEQKKQTADAYMTKKNLPPKTMKALEAVKENQFLREFEDELKQDDADRFLAEFEAELEGEALEYERAKKEQSADDDTYMDQIEQLVNASQAEPEAEDMDLMPDPALDMDAFAGQMPDPVAPPQGMEELGSLFDDDFSSSFSGDLSFMEEAQPEKNDAKESLLEEEPYLFNEEEPYLPESGDTSFSGSGEPSFSEDEETILPEEEMLDDESIMKLLSGMSEDEALSDIGKMLEADEQEIALEDLSAEPENLMHAADLAENSQTEKKAKKEKKKGVCAKL